MIEADKIGFLRGLKRVTARNTQRSKDKNYNHGDKMTKILRNSRCAEGCHAENYQEHLSSTNID
jgi:hypothetical protein